MSWHEFLLINMNCIIVYDTKAGIDVLARKLTKKSTNVTNLS
jgi:hypothetical protein